MEHKRAVTTIAPRGAAPQGMQVMGAEQHSGGRLSVLDGSFLRLDSPRAPMHVGWSAIFAAPRDDDRPTLQSLRQRAASRLKDIEWCRWKLQAAQLGLTEPRWIRDPDFALASHVVALGTPEQAVSDSAFVEICDAFLSEPLDRNRPLWKIALIPRLEDGRVGLIGKVHHALVDGIAALQMVGLVLDMAPVRPVRAPNSSSAASHIRARRTLQPLRRSAIEALALLKGTAGLAARPSTTAAITIRGSFRAIQAGRHDLLPRAPASILNVPTGARRALVGYHAARSDLRSARRGGSLNDVGLAIVAGALRALAIRHGETPTAPYKAMVPVSMRGAGDTGPGNRISMLYIPLPVDLRTPEERLESVRAQTQRLKNGSRGENMQALYAAGGHLPAPLRSPIAKAMASPRVFNLTISQSPGPRGVVHLLGCELQEVYSVVPLTEGHALAIGMVRYRKELFIGCYADPEALPDFRLLPALLETELRALANPPPRLDRSQPPYHSGDSDRGGETSNVLSFAAAANAVPRGGNRRAPVTSRRAH